LTAEPYYIVQQITTCPTQYLTAFAANHNLHET